MKHVRRTVLLRGTIDFLENGAPRIVEIERTTSRFLDRTRDRDQSGEENGENGRKSRVSRGRGNVSATIDAHLVRCMHTCTRIRADSVHGRVIPGVFEQVVRKPKMVESRWKNKSKT